jgi:hypothetical protein
MAASHERLAVSSWLMAHGWWLPMTRLP